MFSKSENKRPDPATQKQDDKGYELLTSCHFLPGQHLSSSPGGRFPDQEEFSSRNVLFSILASAFNSELQLTGFTCLQMPPPRTASNGRRTGRPGTGSRRRWTRRNPAPPRRSSSPMPSGCSTPPTLEPPSCTSTKMFSTPRPFWWAMAFYELVNRAREVESVFGSAGEKATTLKLTII